MRKYIVQEGDTLSEISKVTGVRLPLLMAANPQLIHPDDLHPGMVLVIPELDKPKPAQQGSQSVSTSQPVSSLQSVHTPQSVPAPMGADTGSGDGSGHGGAVPTFFGFVWPHVVQPGETWETLQQSYKTSLADLMQLNPGKQGRPLAPGEVVYVPGMSGIPSTSATVPQYPSGAGSLYGPSYPMSLPGGIPFGAVTGLDQEGTAGYPQGPHTHFPYRGQSVRDGSYAGDGSGRDFAMPIPWYAIPWHQRGYGGWIGPFPVGAENWRYEADIWDGQATGYAHLGMGLEGWEESSSWESDWLESGLEFVNPVEGRSATGSSDEQETP